MPLGDALQELEEVDIEQPIEDDHFGSIEVIHTLVVSIEE
jgi:hypothetical protein